MREIIMSSKAEKKTAALFEYLELKWSERVRIVFAKKLYKATKVIQSHPESFPKSEVNPNQHFCVVTKQTTIYYKFNDKQIRILSIFDTRQNPTRIKKIR
jgi:plasmid stabilization system protein ParE